MLAMKLLEEAGPSRELGWLLALFLGFFLLMVIVGWWSSSREGGQAEPAHELASHSQHTAQEAAVETTGPDDLTRLEGIGPKVARLLHESGITTFSALSKANAGELQKDLSTAGLQMMNAEGWIEQATLAAKGDWQGLQKLQNELKGGRRKS